ncbi:hypothetical protein Bca101_020228 [Brassica carinata]
MAVRVYIKSELPSFPVSFVGGHARPSHLPADPFSSPIPAWAEVLEADREVVPIAPLKHPHPYLLDDGPRSEIREEGLTECRTQVRDMMAQCDLLIQRVRASSRWEVMREWLEKRIDLGSCGGVSPFPASVRSC